MFLFKSAVTSSLLAITEGEQWHTEAEVFGLVVLLALGLIVGFLLPKG